jgi:hypothetical protein
VGVLNKSSRTFHAVVLLLAMAFYMLVHQARALGFSDGIWLSLPSFLFPFACFSIVALVPLRLGGTGGHPLKLTTIWTGTLLAVLIFEGIGPRFGFGKADPLDAIALTLGSFVYSFSSYLAKRRSSGYDARHEPDQL